ncbi:hypothetical protein P2H44_11360 [Albimonas sp. CAU 1670]|uniref:hypothetical protein n=1 Tax=Albimonas sp. CAU 1670 TaxID=3032599 RepID=UPI0023D99823|nr:hypothetical protein [Albimonas sp. CAU 1670]MDF2233149.1 hypothetical protein [Albimonas sp. CAU 1670]
MATIEMGDLMIESEDAVSGAQERVRQNEDVRSENEDQAETTLSRPWTGDEQVDIAAILVVRRIEETLLMARGSIEAVSSLIGEYEGAGIDRSEGGVALLGDDGELEASIDGPAVEHALGGLDQLRLAVEEWKSEILGGTENL